MSMLEQGIYIVATPIGNLADITYRAVEILKSVDKIAAEDTRHSKKLLEHYGITTQLTSLHEHNEQQKSQSLLDFVATGSSLAVISDAGTPLICDPGYNIVALAKEQGINVLPVPGPCALIAALSAAGLASDKFCFLGFAPNKKISKEKFISNILQQTTTSIFYEVPHRIETTLKLLQAELKDANRKITIAKEISKKFETIITTTDISSIFEQLTKNDNLLKGEIVVLVEGQRLDNSSQVTDASLELSSSQQKILSVLISELPTKQAVSLGVNITGLPRNAVYEYCINNKKLRNN